MILDHRVAVCHRTVGLDKTLFFSTGGESNECAIELAKAYTANIEIVGLGASCLGMTYGQMERNIMPVVKDGVPW